MTEPQIREKFDKKFLKRGILDDDTPIPTPNEIKDFFLSIRTQEREELEKKIDGMNFRSDKKIDIETLAEVKALLKEQ